MVGGVGVVFEVGEESVFLGVEVDVPNEACKVVFVINADSSKGAFK